MDVVCIHHPFIGILGQHYMSKQRKRIIQAEIDELRKTTPYADLDDLKVYIETERNVILDDELSEDLLTYLKRFAKPSNIDRSCIGCGEFMGGFEWGLVHGNGFCRVCGWPATLNHFIKVRHGNGLTTIHGVLLQTHPDHVSIDKKDKPK